MFKKNVHVSCFKLTGDSFCSTLPIINTYAALCFVLNHYKFESILPLRIRKEGLLPRISPPCPSQCTCNGTGNITVIRKWAVAVV